MKYKLADSVLHRIVQILQEALLTGVDCSDIMRQLELEQDSENPNSLVMTSDYKQLVKNQHDSMLNFIEEVRNKTDE